MYSSSEEDEAPELESLNISNDQYYRPPQTLPTPKQSCQIYRAIRKHTSSSNVARDKPAIPILGVDIPRYGSPTIRHSLPAYDLWRPLYPPSVSEEKFKNLHRPKMRHFKTGPQSIKLNRDMRRISVKSLSRTIYGYQKKLRNKVMKAISEGQSREDIVNNILLIHQAKDLSAKRGELFLFEYCEEYPPVLSQVGMASNVKILTHNATNEDQKNPKPQQNQTGFREAISNKASTKPVYYSQPKPGSEFKVIENNLYRAPIYEHQMPSNDFLIIRTRNSLYIRNIMTVFTVGQTMPLVAIPKPTPAAISRFRCDLSNIYAERLMMEANKVTKEMAFPLRKLTKLFPDYSEQTLVKRFRNKGAVVLVDQNSLLQGNSGIGLMAPRDLRRAFTPEQYCLNMTMLAARQRLRELNYTESMIVPTDDAELETEVKAAPWNTSQAVLSASTGRHYLDFKGHLIDPTGSQREGFSCVPWVKSPSEEQQVKEMQLQRTVDQEKRSLFATASRPASLTRMPIEKNPLSFKIKREKLERLASYRHEAQIIAQTQSKVLSSNEVLSSEDDDDEDSDEEDNLDASFDEQLKDLDKLVIGNQSTKELNFEKEEELRRELLNELINDKQRTPEQTDSEVAHVTASSQESVNNFKSYENKVLRISRTYNTNEGMIERTEIVKEPKIIALYVKKRAQEGTSNAPTPMDFEDIPNNQTATPNASFDHRNKLDKSHNESLRRQSDCSLGPNELCRAEGMVLRISKKVLDAREMRRANRQSNDF